VLAAAGVPREFGEDVVSLLFLISLLGTLITFIWLGIVVVRSALMPSGVGWLIIAHPLLLAALLFFYPIGIVIGLVWAGIGWLALRGRPAAAS
jgi:hypothetical protein